MRQRGSRDPMIPCHLAESDHPALAAAAADIEVVIPQRPDLGGKGEGSIVGRLWHTENESRTRPRSRVPPGLKPP
jgi:hypothetical protein